MKSSLAFLSALCYYAHEAMSCQILPVDHAWNTPIDCLPVHPNSAIFVSTIGNKTGIHPDFGSGQWDGADIGIPFLEVTGSQTKYSASFYYPEESDVGPYAIPLNAPIEGGVNGDGDRHAIAVDTENCILYELYDAHPQASSWNAGSGVVANLSSYQLRPDTWTSADAAGLLIYPGLLKYEEVKSGSINHAIRFTAPQTRKAHLWPARHDASSLTATKYPPMGLRFRLKASFDVSSFSADNQVILKAMKKYGIILADNGSPWFISGSPNSGWDDDDLHQLQTGVKGINFEAVDASYLMINRNSGLAKQICNNCGNGVCNATVGETIATCFKDCCFKRGTNCTKKTQCCSSKCRSATGTCA